MHAAALAAGLAWHPLGRWVALALALVGLLVAAAVYRARPPAFPLLRGRRSVGLEEEPEEPASTPRPA